jgi:demethylmenaquinone methyltransferase/2-methoxy-6-polyprenyl-1,4-benzoquinol methylase
MNTRASFGDTPIARFLFWLIALVMESPLRRRFFDPIKALRAAGIQSGQIVLEVGCGTGFFTIPAAELVGREGRVYALDPLPSAIEEVALKVREAGLPNVRLIRGDATEAALASGSIDLALLFGVIPSPTLPLDRLLPEMSRVLKSGAVLAVWTALPWWSPTPLTSGGLFVYAGKRDGVYDFRRASKD